MRYGIAVLFGAILLAEGSADEFSKRWTVTRPLAIGVAEAMPSEQYAFKPNPASMSFGEQMAHLAWANYAFCAAIRDQKMPQLPDSKEKQAIVKYVADSFDYCSTQIAGLSDAQMNATHSTPDGKLTGRETLLALYVHMAHHRGQAEVYLRIKGIAPPRYVF